MNIFDYDIDRVAKNLITQARVYECNYIEAWDKHTSPMVKEQVSLEEVLEYLANTFF